MTFKKENLFVLSPYIGVLVGLYIFNNAFAAILIYHLGIISSILIYKKRIDFNSLFKCNKRRHLLSLIVCSLSGVMFYYLWDFFKLPSLNLSETMKNIGLFGNYKIIFLIYFSTVHPLLEELYWRFILKPSNKFISLTELMFGFYHILVVRLFIRFEFVILCFIVLVIVARFWRHLHQKEGNNLPIFLSHAVADFSIMFFMFMLY